MSDKASIKKQVEYYLSDKNLAEDQFFYSKIEEAKEVQLISLTFEGMDRP